MALINTLDFAGVDCRHRPIRNRLNNKDWAQCIAYMLVTSSVKFTVNCNYANNE